jgi:hypothetical protein
VSFSRSCDSGLPRVNGGSASTSNVSRPAQRSRMLRPACSRGRIPALSIEGFGDIVTSIAAPIATGWNDSCRVGIAPTEGRHLRTAHTDTEFLPIKKNGFTGQSVEAEGQKGSGVGQVSNFWLHELIHT